MKKPILSEDDQEILDLWKKGLTGAQIAKKTYNTRNAVMGKLYRWRQSKIIDYKSTKTREAAIKEKVRIANRKEALGKGKPRSQVKKELPLIKFLDNLPPPPPLSVPVKFMQLTPDSCRFVVSGGVAKDYLFCNKQKKLNSAYCEDHHGLCYVPMSAAKDRSKRNAATA
jgi:hypothetical protein